MAQHLSQHHEQKQTLQQRLTKEQLLAVRVLELPVTALEQKVNAELDDNPALERGDADEGQEVDTSSSWTDDDGADDYETAEEREERADALNDALEAMGSDDEMPEAAQYISQHNPNADDEPLQYGERDTFHDTLTEQLMALNLSERQKELMDYVVGSLDTDGLLRKTADTIADELVIYNDMDVTVDEVQTVIDMLKTLEPAGIGAGSLQECLLLQIRRRPPSEMRRLMERVVKRCFNHFLNKRWDKLEERLNLSPREVRQVFAELRKLNPKPGSALGEVEGFSTTQVTPDFIVEMEHNGAIAFAINDGNVPELFVSPMFIDMVDAYANKSTMNRREREALLYAKDKTDRAQSFIDAIQQRRRSMYLTMKAIIEIQHDFFASGDEGDLKPMTLKDVADRTGLDVSTVSRVGNMKYVRTRWGTFKLRHFFSNSVIADNGEEMATRKIKEILRTLIENEDKQNPLADDAMTLLMQQKGFPIARRTLAKYREQLGFPVARLRRA